MWKTARRMLTGYWGEFVKTSVLTNMPEWADVYEASRAGSESPGAGAVAAVAPDAPDVAATPGMVGLTGVESSEKIAQETPGNV